jgi:hypothetical protein
MTGTGMPSSIMPKEEQAGVDIIPHGDNPTDGWDLGAAVKVTAYGVDHIMAPLEAVDSEWMRAVFPEVPTGGLEAASGRVDLLIGHDNCRMFPVEHRRVENAALHRSRFRTGWIASGRPPRQGDPAISMGAATGAEEATSTGAATGAEEATSTGAATGTGEATSTGAATGTEEVASKEEAVNKEEPAHIATVDKPAKPPDRLDEQFAVTSAVFIQEPQEPAELEEPEEPAELEELEEYRKLEEDLVWDERSSGEDDWLMSVGMDWSHGCGAEDNECIPEQTGPPARICA